MTCSLKFSAFEKKLVFELIISFSSQYTPKSGGHGDCQLGWENEIDIKKTNHMVEGEIHARKTIFLGRVINDIPQNVIFG